MDEKKNIFPITITVISVSIAYGIKIRLQIIQYFNIDNISHTGCLTIYSLIIKQFITQIYFHIRYVYKILYVYSQQCSYRSIRTTISQICTTEYHLAYKIS
jgi:hypothetical protein